MIWIEPTTGEGPRLSPSPGATMLILTRKATEKVLIGDNVIVEVVEIRGNQVRLGIEAPGDVLVLRGELKRKRGG